MLIDQLKEEEAHIGYTKDGKPRKRRPKKSILYFTDDTQQAIVEYRLATSEAERNLIFNSRIYYAFYKLAENIIHTFKFYYTEVDSMEELKHEVITFLLEKLHLYDESKGRAYSYFGTIAKRYLIVYNNNNYKRLKDKAEVSEIDDDQKIFNDIMYEQTNSYNELAFFNRYVEYVDENLLDIFTKDHEARVGDAILELFKRRETIEIFNKKALFIYIKEITETTTPTITKVIKVLKQIYKKMLIEHLQHGDDK